MRKIQMSAISIYNTNSGETKLEITLADETIWLSQKQIAEFYQKSKSNISEHKSYIFKEGELSRDATVRKFRTVQSELGNSMRNLYKYSIIQEDVFRIIVPLKSNDQVTPQPIPQATPQAEKTKAIRIFCQEPKSKESEAVLKPMLKSQLPEPIEKYLAKSKS